MNNPRARNVCAHGSKSGGETPTEQAREKNSDVIIARRRKTGSMPTTFARQVIASMHDEFELVGGHSTVLRSLPPPPPPHFYDRTELWRSKRGSAAQDRYNRPRSLLCHSFVSADGRRAGPSAALNANYRPGRREHPIELSAAALCCRANRSLRHNACRYVPGDDRTV